MDKQEFRAESRNSYMGMIIKFLRRFCIARTGLLRLKQEGAGSQVFADGFFGITRGFVNGRVHRGYEEFWKYLEQYNHQKSHDCLFVMKIYEEEMSF
jgi:hypothetical protein